MEVELRNGSGIPSEDFKLHSDMLANPDNSRYLEVRWHLPQTQEQCREWVMHPTHYYIYADDEMVGTISATINRENGYASVGYFIDSGSRGRGIGKRAVGLLLESLRPEGVRYVEAGVLEVNSGGLAFLTSCGFVRVGVEINKMRSPYGGRCGRIVFGRQL